jgi:hypothetical protein
MNAYDFENFPRGKLPIRMTRRQFFTGLVDEVKAFSQTDDHPYFRLCDLGGMSNGELAFVIPFPLPGCEIVSQDGYIWGKPAQARTPIRLFPADSRASYVLQQFDSKKNISDASRSLAIQAGWDKQRAFAYVRGVFLWLVLARLYAPGNQKLSASKH